PACSEHDDPHGSTESLTTGGRRGYRGCMRARVLVVLAAAVVAAGIVAGAGSGGSGPVSISVDATHPGRSIPRPFLGLSIEYQSVPEYMGSRDAPNRAFAGLAAALSAAENAPIGLRIGGNSGDQSWWNPS